MNYKSLQAKMDSLGNPAELCDVPVGAYQYPVPSQLTNWRDEQSGYR